MESTQGMSGNDTEELAQEVGEGLGEKELSSNEVNDSHEKVGSENISDPIYVQKRLKQQKRAHDREMREMQARMAEMQSQMTPNNQSFDANPDVQPGGNQPGNMDEAIHKAVSVALQHREMEERKARDAQSQQHIAKQYQELHKHLDKTADKYDDFDDIVRSDSAPFTAHMRDAALMLPKQGPGSAGEVLYMLGKNPEDLSRIAKLHPVDQASELVKLSHALISGGEQKGTSPRPIGQIKANPVTNSAGVTEKTPISSIRDRMKKGTFK
jgi:hypothetical protein